MSLAQIGACPGADATPGHGDPRSYWRPMKVDGVALATPFANRLGRNALSSGELPPRTSSATSRPSRGAIVIPLWVTSE